MGPIDDRVPVFAKNTLRAIDIPDGVTTEQITEKFSEYGELTDLYEPPVGDDPERITGKKRAVLTYRYGQSGEAALKALGEEFEWDGKTVTLSHGRNRDRPRWRRSIYVGNLERNADYDDMVEALEAHFGQYGEILSTRLVRNHDYGNLRGFGFIEFLYRRSIYAALDSDDALFEGRNLVVKLRDKPPQRDFNQQGPPRDE